MRFSAEDIAGMASRERAAMVNSLSGYKPANLVGTADREGNTNLAIAMISRKRLSNTKFARMRHTSKVSLRVARANTVQYFTGDDREVPWLRVHRRRRTHCNGQNLFDQRFRHWIGFVASDAPAPKKDIIKLHLRSLRVINAIV